MDQKLQSDLNECYDSSTANTPNPAAKNATQRSEPVKENAPSKKIRIIDNIGINKDGQLVDVIANEDLIRDNFLSRARRMVSSEYYPQVEALVDRLVISFGARNYSEVIETALSNQNPQDSKADVHLKGWLISRLSTIINLGVQPYGSCLRDIKHPLIYINTGQIPNNDNFDLIKVWDHETAHLIYQVDPETKINFWENVLELSALQTFISALMSLGSTTAVYGIMSKARGVDMRSLIQINEKEFKKTINKMMKLQFLPNLLLSQSIHYEIFNDDEILARKEAAGFPTPAESFNNMIRIVPHSSE